MAGQNVNQVLFWVEKSMELLSNRVFNPFLSRIDGEINGFAWGLKVTNGGRERERELLFYFERAGMNKRKKITVGEEEDGYKYPLSPNGHLSHSSASLQVRQCCTSQDSKGKSEV